MTIADTQRPPLGMVLPEGHGNCLQILVAVTAEWGHGTGYGVRRDQGRCYTPHNAQAVPTTRQYPPKTSECCYEDPK